MPSAPVRPRAYIAGPMTGIEDFNFPAFFEAEKRLRKARWLVINPAAMDVKAGDGGPGIEPQPHEHYMRRDLPQLWRCTHVAVLPGWELSRGARQEVGTALAIGLVIVDVESLRPFARDEVIDLLASTRQPDFII